MKFLVLPWIGSAYLRLVGLTSRIVWENRAVRDELERSKKGFIYTFWHGRQFMLAYLHRRDQIHPLVSKSSDGEMIARVCRSFGLEAIRGSSSRGGTPAILELKEKIMEGERVGITPDGPRGPLQKVQLGALYLAQKLNCPIVPVAFGARRKMIFGSWDRFIVPFPLNRISMVYGDPIWVRSKEAIASQTEVLQQSLNKVTERADELARS